jgi:phosphate-selective porin OprO/OprP
LALDDWLTLRVGQWKSEFSRERIDSSGKQQLVERSISNYWFTVDRQRGLAASARLAEGTGADTKVWLGLLSGSGLGGEFESGQMLWLGRVQWNPAGELLPFSQSDLARRQRAVSSVALAGIVGQTSHTRFSSSGGGNLPGQQQGDYDLHQLLFETAAHYRGMGWQQELHWKRLDDTQSGEQRDLMGGYAQLGSFLDEWWPGVPPALEVVGRYALVDPDRDRSSDTQQEWSLGANWFFSGHRNKLTLDYSWLDFEDPVQGESAQRLRLQWELSI